jgi:hypothetical protein
MAGPKRANDIVRKAKPFLHKIEGVEADIESEKGRFMAFCKGKRKIIKDLYKAAKDEEVAPTVLKGVVEQRKLQRKIDKIPADFDLTEAAAYRELEAAFGPLGKAAASRAGFGADDGEGEPLTGAEAKAAQAARDHEAGIARIGRGEDGATTPSS